MVHALIIAELASAEGAVNLKPNLCPGQELNP